MNTSFTSIHTCILLIAFMAIGTALSGCSKYKTTSDLNLYHPQVMSVYTGSAESKSYNISGIFCSDTGFRKRANTEPFPQLTVVLPKGYSTFIRGYISEYSAAEPNPYFQVTPQLLQQNPNYQQQCGVDKKYPYTYIFALNIEQDYPDSKWKKVRMREYDQIIEQIRRDKFIDIGAVVVPMVSIKIEVSSKPVRLHFTDEQIEKLFSTSQ